MIRVLHVITTMDIGGAERLMVDLLPLLQQHDDLDVELLLFNGADTAFKRDLQQQGIKIHQLGYVDNVDDLWSVYNPRLIARLRKYLGSYDIIHTHNTACQLFVPIAKAVFGSKSALVTTEHSTNNRRRSKWWCRPIDSWMYSRYKAVVCISDQTQVSLENYLGKSDNLVTINNGVDVKRFLRPVKDITGQERFVITMVAGLRAEKDHETVLRAMTHLPANYRLQLVGGGVREAELKALTTRMGLDDRVTFLGIRSDVPDVLEHSDIALLSSHWEGFGLVAVEGMASGRPFIASDVDGLLKVVGGYGVTFPHGDDKALAEKILELCNNPEMYREVATSCQQRAREFDISLMADRYYELYKSLNRQQG